MSSHEIPLNPPKNHQTHCKTLSPQRPLWISATSSAWRPGKKRATPWENKKQIQRGIRQGYMNMYMYIYIYRYVYVYVNVYVYIYTHVYIYIHMYMYKIWDAFPKKQFIQGYMNCFLEMRPRSYTYTCVYIYTYTYTYLYINIHIYIYTYIYTYIYIYIFATPH